MSWVATAIGGSALVSYAAASEQADASEQAADTQAEATNLASIRRQEQFEQTRQDLAPYRQAGEEALPGLQGLVTSPQAQREFITQNPFYETLADDAQERIFENQAARGKLGSGDTATALQDNLLKLGSDLLNQNISQRANLVNIGQTAATRIGQMGAQASNTIADLRTSGANARAAGIVGSQRAYTQGVQNAINTGTNLYALNQMYGGNNTTTTQGSATSGWHWNY